VVYAVFVCVSAGLLVLTFDSRKQAFAQIGHLAGRGNWGQVLAAAGSLTVFPAPERLNLTRALFHTSRLNSELFRFRLDESLDLNPEMKKSWGMYLPLSEVMLELGQLNLAEHFAHEALELEGARPATLRQLVVVQTLKQRPQAARLFQAVLDRIPFHSHFPITGAGIGNQELSSEAAAKPPASWLVKTDYPASRIPTEILLQQALHTNRSNRMAFEYLMAHFLLSRQLGKFSRELNRMVDFDYPAIPRHYEEAILLCRSLSVQPAPDLRGRRISPESNERFGMFCRLLEESRGELKQLEPMIARGYGQTFWYYYYYGENAGQTPKLPANSTGGE
jgi:hypothetical protein